MRITKISAISVVVFFCLSTALLAQKKIDFHMASRAVSDIQAKDQVETAENFKRLYKAVPPPKLTHSQERQNLSKRLERFNVADKISFIYLIDFSKVMGFFTVKGKVSSVNSMLTCTQQLVDDGQDNNYGRGNVHVVDSPDLDGSYGSNGDAIFFFTDKDIYVEWNGVYMLCDQYIAMEQPPELYLELGEKKPIVKNESTTTKPGGE